MEKVGNAGERIDTLLGDRQAELDKFFASLADVGPQIEQAAKDMQAIGEKINAGEGTLGKLINDPSLYDDTRKAVNQVSESFESSEEQGVVRSFVGVLFGALI